MLSEAEVQVLSAIPSDSSSLPLLYVIRKDMLKKIAKFEEGHVYTG